MLPLQFFYVLLALVASFVVAVPLAEDGDSVNAMTPYHLNMSGPHLAMEGGWDPSFFWDSRSTVQVWMGKEGVQVGSIVEEKLYGHMWDLLDKQCPKDSLRRVCHKAPAPNAEIKTTCMDLSGKHHGCYLIVSAIDAEWTTDAIRDMLLKSVAGAIKAATMQDVSNGGNCWKSGVLQKVCNVGDVIRVNFPELPEDRANYMHIRLFNWYHYGPYNCCGEGTRGRIDGALDDIKPSMKLEFPKQADNSWYRDSRCIINGAAMCL